MRGAVLACLAALFLMTGAAIAQVQAVVLLVDPERVLQQSQAGQSLLSIIETERATLVAETEALSSAFEVEERALTALRGTLDREEFQARADEFDTRVRAARAERDQAAENLAQQAEELRQQFFQRLNAIYTSILRETRAVAILDLRSVILANRGFDITDVVIARLDAEAQGPPLPPEPPLDDTAADE
ncbi:Skp family chaperone for outer membrane proteins [Rubricella aquisinus]|uniref:Skp family chaperone for outer membrane proteins n=1 Tax=Rubricella aquisinus TaxID=2028108 RepID=A0A840WHX5_9RHOB|nr:OmpH family outer membrane protein [Rubricella aquisinus]MBB5514719.1 Skp family chaperone for outer membrane proteins [Rubricella aquisinus]